MIKRRAGGRFVEQLPKFSEFNRQSASIVYFVHLIRNCCSPFPLAGMVFFGIGIHSPAEEGGLNGFIFVHRSSRIYHSKNKNQAAEFQWTSRPQQFLLRIAVSLVSSRKLRELDIKRATSSSSITMSGNQLLRIVRDTIDHDFAKSAH